MSQNQEKLLPRVGITIGDLAGIGTEIVLKTIADADVREKCQPIVICDADFLRVTAADLSLNADYPIIKSAAEITPANFSPLIFDVANVRENIVFGVESAETGRTSAEFIETAVRLCLDQAIDAITTAPISKNALSMAGVKFPGHTEFLAHLTGTKEFAMSFFADKLRVVLLSTHLSLKNALELVKTDALVKLIRLADREFKNLGIENPRLAVAALNPHGGENRLFGAEEADEINPAIAICQNEDINVAGAFSADTLFLRAAKGEFDAVIALYHDQATIPVKSIAFGAAVNVTLGLPIIRTSVDHGTAFDIAGKNLAEFSSLKTAVLLAAELSVNKKRRTTSES